MTLGFLGKATVLYAIGNICLRASSFLLFPIYAHYLPIDDYGLLMTLLLTMQFMLVAMNCGTEQSIIRYAKHYEKSGHLASLMGTTFFLSFISSVLVACICLTLLIPFFQNVLHRRDVGVLIALTLSSSFFQALTDSLTAYYRSQHRPIMYTLAGVATALVLTVLSYIFLSPLKMGVNGALLAKLITYGWILSIIAWHIYSKTGFGISFKLVPKLLHFGLPLSLSNLGQFSVTGASIYFLSLLAGLDSVAVFSLGHKLASVLLMVLVIPFQFSFQPYVFSQLEDPTIKKQMARLLSYLMWSIAGGSFCILFAARLVLPLFFRPEFGEAYFVTLTMMPAMAFLGIFYYAETLLKATQKSYIIGLVVTVSAVFSIIANFILVYYLAWHGAMLASNITFLILGGCLFVIGLKAYPLPIEWRRLRTAAVLFAGVLLINFILAKSNLYLYCIVELTIAAIILLIAFRSSLLDEGEKKYTRQIFYKAVTLFKRLPRKKTGELSYESPSSVP
jgi:O-antigen/teichoic acid export membrane protein